MPMSVFGLSRWEWEQAQATAEWTMTELYTIWTAEKNVQTLPDVSSRLVPSPPPVWRKTQRWGRWGGGAAIPFGFYLLVRRRCSLLKKRIVYHFLVLREKLGESLIKLCLLDRNIEGRRWLEAQSSACYFASIDFVRGTGEVNFLKGIEWCFFFTHSWGWGILGARVCVCCVGVRSSRRCEKRIFAAYYRIFLFFCSFPSIICLLLPWCPDICVAFLVFSCPWW